MYGRRRQIAASPTSTSMLIRVRWNARTVGFNHGSVESVIQKACKHFRLGGIEHELVLESLIEGNSMELSDDTMGRLAENAIVKLRRIPEERHECHYGRGDEASWADTASQALAFPHICDAEVPIPRIEQPDGERSSTMVLVKTLTGKTIRCHIPPNGATRDLKGFIQDKEGIPLDQQRLIFRGVQLCDCCILSSHGVVDGDTVHLVLRLRGGKPVIYLFPPSPVPDAMVSVRLVPQWTFSHIYPLCDIKSSNDGKQSITWSVSASPNGALVDNCTGVELSYLFWEAQTRTDSLTSPEVSVRSVGTAEYFDPSHPSLEPGQPTTVLLPFVALIPYLDAALKTLTLHTSARNDFITYWLPALSKTPYVALRFVPQAAYERAA
ncbi:hypothetical protein K466DRAFT_591013, partial [Polyporus arcularius HHB13444]